MYISPFPATHSVVVANQIQTTCPTQSLLQSVLRPIQRFRFHMQRRNWILSDFNTSSAKWRIKTGFSLQINSRTIRSLITITGLINDNPVSARMSLPTTDRKLNLRNSPSRAKGIDRRGVSCVDIS